MELNKTQSSPAGWTVSHAEPRGPVLPCSGCQPGCSGVCWCLLPVLLTLGGLHVKEDGFVVKRYKWREQHLRAASQTPIRQQVGQGSLGTRGVCSEPVPGQPQLKPVPRAEGSTAKPPWIAGEACPELCSFWGDQQCCSTQEEGYTWL